MGFYPCKGCGAMLRPKAGDCCVFCSYGSVPCPPVQDTEEKLREGMRTRTTMDHLDPGYRTALLVSASLNLAMFVIEGGVGLMIGSAALLADAVDFIEDAGIYGLAVSAIGWPARSRAMAGLAMGGAMSAVGLVAVLQVVERVLHGGAPLPAPMAATAALALAVNFYCAARLLRYKRGDASIRSIWLSTRNDAMLNALTVAAAGLIHLASSGWPDIAAGIVIAAINFYAAGEIVIQAGRELRSA